MLSISERSSEAEREEQRRQHLRSPAGLRPPQELPTQRCSRRQCLAGAAMESVLEIQWVPIGTLFPSPSNPRINDEAVPHVAASIKRFGWRQPVVAKRSGEVIAGNTRLKAARSLGQETVPVHWFEGTDLDATAFAIADNRSHEYSTWDEPALAKLLAELRTEDALEGVGYSTDDIDDLLHSIASEVEPREV